MPRRPPIHKQLGISKKQVRKYLRAIHHRNRFGRPIWVGALAYVIGVVAMFCLLLWPLYIGLIPGWFTTLIVLFVGHVAGWWFMESSYRKRLMAHLRTPLCIHCGYNLQGQPAAQGTPIHCPECGKDSPRIGALNEPRP